MSVKIFYDLDDDNELTYVPVEEDDEYEALIKVFSELLEDTDLV